MRGAEAAPCVAVIMLEELDQVLPLWVLKAGSVAEDGTLPGGVFAEKIDHPFAHIDDHFLESELFSLGLDLKIGADCF